MLDALADRVSDVLLLSALWVLGASPWLCLVIAALTLLLGKRTPDMRDLILT